MKQTTPLTGMDIAFQEAEAAAARGEVPVGAVVTNQAGEIVAQAGNRTRQLNDPSAHAEVLAIREACAKSGSERLTGHNLYVTLEPCAMCAATISFARINRLYYGAKDEKMGGTDFFTKPTCHHRPEIYDGISEQKSAQLLKTFFAAKRD